ncbi:MAG: glycoside hydrolase family 3 N-terminal domain-containing protein [Rhodomicrobium sp.]
MKRDSASDIENLLGTMSLEEKLGQLTMIRADEAEVRKGHVGSILDLQEPARIHKLQEVALNETRLGVPLLFALDVLHGYETVFSIPLAEAAAMDAGLWEVTARVAAHETAAAGIALTFAPMLDVSRDPRWGRMAESPGEDPWLASRFAEAKVRGFQGAALRPPFAIGATAKHFAAYGAVTAGREYASVDVSSRTMHEVYLPPFAAAVREGVAAIMPSFNDLAGIPMTVHRGFLRGLLRARYGFDGVIVSDFNAIAELISHGVAADTVEAAALALNAGVDIDMASGAYLEGLPQALGRGLVSEADIDTAVKRVLDLKVRLGLFERPFADGSALPQGTRENRRAIAREAARKSIVLLQNRGGILPLTAPAKLVVAGPLADAPGEMLGPWHAAGKAEEAASFLQGLRGALPGLEIAHFEDFAAAEAKEAAGKADTLLLCLGETATMSGEAASRARPSLPDGQTALLREALRFGKPIVVALTSGRPVIEPFLFEAADAVLATWFLGSEAGNALADILTGKANPSGKLAVSWPADVGQIPIFYAQRPTGRPASALRESSKYLDAPVAPLFPFGHGLSYAQFAYSGLRVSAEVLAPDDRISVEAGVTNQGTAGGEETAFLFIHDVTASVARPLLELRGLAKIKLDPGQKGTVRFELAAGDLAFPDEDGAPQLEAGAFEILVGPSADRCRLLCHAISLSLLKSPAQS